MLLINLFIYFTIIMARHTIELIKTLPINDRTKEMVSFVGFNQKLARTLGQINFLIDCRSLDILPTFILNKTAHIKKEERKRRIAIQVSRLHKTMLNEEIRDAFRRKAFLQRSLSRSADILKTRQEEWNWLYNQGRLIFLEELQTVKGRLMKKLKSLCEKQGHPTLNTATSKTNKLGRNFDIDEPVRPNERHADRPTAHDDRESTASSSKTDIISSTSSHHQDDYKNITSFKTKQDIVTPVSTYHQDDNKDITLSQTDIIVTDSSHHQDDCKSISSSEAKAIAINHRARHQDVSKDITLSSNTNVITSGFNNHLDNDKSITPSKTATIAKYFTHHQDIHETNPSLKTNLGTAAAHEEVKFHLKGLATWKSKFLGLWCRLCTFFRHLISGPRSSPSDELVRPLHLVTARSELNSGQSKCGTAAQLTVRHNVAVSEPQASKIPESAAPITTENTGDRNGPHMWETAAHALVTTEQITEARSEPRIVNLSNRPVSKTLTNILEKGPKYALTQKVTPSTIQSVEAGIERAFYGLKWQYAIEERKKKQNHKTRKRRTIYHPRQPLSLVIRQLKHMSPCPDHTSKTVEPVNHPSYLQKENSVSKILNPKFSVSTEVSEKTTPLISALPR